MEDDDFYDPSDSFLPHQAQNGYNQHGTSVNPTDAEEEFEEEVEDDDDEFNIITEAPADVTPDITHPRHALLRNETQRSASVDSAAAVKPSTPSVPVKLESASPAVVSVKPAVPSKPGSAYPALHTSTLDVNANPVHPATGKLILSTDLDADFPEDDKPWRRPGSDITDYFNYGFDEFTWASYCLKQQELRKEVTDQKKQLEDMQTFMNMGGIPGMPGAPPGPPATPGPVAAPGGGAGGLPPVPGMPDNEMMQNMLANMMAQGLDPSVMDPMSFMQHAQAMMGGGQPGGGGGQGQPSFSGHPQGFGGQGNQQSMGYGGYNQQGGYAGRGRGGGGRRWQ